MGDTPRYGQYLRNPSTGEQRWFESWEAKQRLAQGWRPAVNPATRQFSRPGETILEKSGSGGPSLWDRFWNYMTNGWWDEPGFTAEMGFEPNDEPLDMWGYVPDPKVEPRDPSIRPKGYFNLLQKQLNGEVEVSSRTFEEYIAKAIKLKGSGADSQSEALQWAASRWFRENTRDFIGARDPMQRTEWRLVSSSPTKDVYEAVFVDTRSPASPSGRQMVGTRWADMDTRGPFPEANRIGGSYRVRFALNKDPELSDANNLAAAADRGMDRLFDGADWTVLQPHLEVDATGFDQGKLAALGQRLLQNIVTQGGGHNMNFTSQNPALGTRATKEVADVLNNEELGSPERRMKLAEMVLFNLETSVSDMVQGDDEDPTGDDFLAQIAAAMAALGGAGSGKPPYQPPDRREVWENVRSYLAAVLSDSSNDKLTGELVELYMQDHKRSYDNPELGLRPWFSVKEKVHARQDYKQIHNLRPDTVDEMNWVTQYHQLIESAGTPAGLRDRQARDYAVMGYSQNQALRNAYLRQESLTGRLQPAFLQNLNQVIGTIASKF